LPRGDVEAHFITNLCHHPTPLLLLGNVHRNLENIVKAAPDSPGFFSLRICKNFHQEK
ncbi:MAG: hypothetical protein Q9183_004312, partial [Haloplaca sp. 2 TL-2023]